MRKAVRRIAAATGVLVAGAALPLVVAAPAQANPGDCTSYLQSKGYRIGQKVLTACRNAADWPSTPPLPCVKSLNRIGVKMSHAEEACTRAIAD